MTFAQFNFHPNILKALNQCGYLNPTPIQIKSIPEILAGHDLVASAQTGTGKTASFVLPILQRLLTKKSASSKASALILTPTRELATQITEAIRKYTKFMRCTVVNIVGGMSYKQQIQGLSRHVDIIVATPGRLLDHMENRRVDLSHVEVLVLDEADRMLDMGFIDDVRAIAKATPHQRQTLLFSATIDDKLSHLIQKLLKNPIRIDLSQERIYPHQIKQHGYHVDNMQHKIRLLEHFLKNESIYKAIIFSATKMNADDLAFHLTKQGLKAGTLHGDLKQGARNRTTEQFRRGKIQFLVATDVASRGLDVHDITHVFNFDLPKFYEDYVHRIGRTGRAGKSGLAISFISPQDVHHIKKIEKFINQTIELHSVEGLEAKYKGEPAKKKSKGGKDKKRKDRHKKPRRRPNKKTRGKQKKKSIG